MTSLMFDSDNPSVLLDPMFSGHRVATYADLMTPELVLQFAGRLVVIDRGLGDPLNIAHVCDVEQGADSPANAAAKIKQWESEGRGHVAVYVNGGNRQATLDACLPVRPYEWYATLDGTMNRGGTYPSAVQFAGADKIGKHVDVSIVFDENWCPLPVNVPRGTVQSLTTVIGSLNASAQILSRIRQGM